MKRETIQPLVSIDEPNRQRAVELIKVEIDEVRSNSEFGCGGMVFDPYEFAFLF